MATSKVNPFPTTGYMGENILRPGRGTFILEEIRGKRNDIYASQSIKEFTESLSQAILQQIPEQKSIGKRFLDLLKGFHPILSYDALTGQPEISFEFTEQKVPRKPWQPFSSFWKPKIEEY